MKSIYDYEYNPRMGILIDIRRKDEYDKNHLPGSININYDKLLLNHKTILDRRKRYFLICDKGKRSKQAVRILSFYGYDVTYVINS